MSDKLPPRYVRDMRGYGANPPDAKWPGGAKVAVHFVLNYEEGGENNILHGDAASEGFLSEIVADWRAKSNDAMGVVLKDPAPRNPRIIADPALKQVFSALLDNAHEAGAERMVIAATLADDLLSVEFNDDGPGFTPEILERLGQPYQSTKGRAGAGLGLFLLVNVMRKLGGAVVAANRRDGGACVRLTLPLEALAPK